MTSGAISWLNRRRPDLRDTEFIDGSIGAVCRRAADGHAARACGFGTSQATSLPRIARPNDEFGKIGQ
jgi:hypothetical protein